MPVGSHLKLKFQDKKSEAKNDLDFCASSLLIFFAVILEKTYNFICCGKVTKPAICGTILKLVLDERKKTCLIFFYFSCFSFISSFAKLPLEVCLAI